ncbi:glycosyltransferase family 4 protein [Psychromonas sp. 14N.309.X.WAT.B.A12]|uniref:glycosyltransferase family 4 protein n=1 Tax=Psychromonas sp. 14N.309.X.WAT.B.A12 TaxID=2998322 RepID=UPI0025B0FE29|nr:glycosyltransferase family 4 protein [Psychromonas sp. 14N.309.X.WAT.B.A12]MDN2662795.1 glycosyltransferase family 4 protein [Psychromonas sp. 14N.309.X.WAT.B.A12]
MSNVINVVHYWGGFPIIATSKWLSALKLVEKCAANNWKNWLVLSKQPDDISLITPFIEAGCEVIYHPRSQGNFDYKSIYRNLKFLLKINCTIFHCYNDHTSPIIAARLANVPIRLWSKLAMSSYYEEGVSPKGLRKLMPSTRITCWAASQVLAISNAAKQEISAQVGFQDRVAVVEVPVDLDVFNYLEGALKIRKEFNISSSDIVITAVGHFAEVKGWDIAVEAFSKVYKKFPNTKLLLVGKKTSTVFYNKIMTLIQELGVEGKVIFLGNRNDIPYILKESDLFIFPSRSEGAGAALVEAMASGIPCVASNTGGIPEIIENGNNGLLFERDNVQDLAEKITNVLSDSDLSSNLVESAKKGLQRFSIERYVDNVSNHYKNLLEYQK